MPDDISTVTGSVKWLRLSKLVLLMSIFIPLHQEWRQVFILNTRRCLKINFRTLRDHRPPLLQKKKQNKMANIFKKEAKLLFVVTAMRDV